MAQTYSSSRRSQMGPKSQSLTRSGSSPHLDKPSNAHKQPTLATPGASQPTHGTSIHRTKTSNSDSTDVMRRRRSSSLSRRHTYHVKTPNQYQSQHAQASPQYRPEGSDAGSVLSTPSVKFSKEFRDPTTSTSRPSHKGGKGFRDVSPTTIRKSHQQDPFQKNGKMAKRVIEGKVVSR